MRSPAALLLAATLLSGCVLHQNSIVLPGGQPATGTTNLGVINKTAPAGVTTSIERLTVFNMDCTPREGMTVRITQPPVHGTAVITQGMDYPTYPPGNPRSACNKTLLPTTYVRYTPSPGFTGSDVMTIEGSIGDVGTAAEKVLITVQ